MRKILILLLFPFQLAVAQNNVQLDSCYVWARQNYPNLKQSELWKEINSLSIQNHETNYLPQVTLNGQISYQSAVTEVPVSMPGISIPTVSKDRYNAYAELQQTIYDGGLTKTNKTLETAILKSNLSQLEVELYKLNEQVAQAFFTALIVDQQKEVILAQIKTIDEQLSRVESGIRNGVTEPSAAMVLKAERINLEQNIVELDAAKSASHQMLELLTGKQFDKNGTFTYQTNFSFNSELLRPELQLLGNQREQLVVQSDLLSKTRNPKLFGFGQLGYGKPGLNMLLDEFKGYYLLGVGISWNAFDWKQTSRQQQVLKLRQEMLQSQEATFIQNLNLLLIQQKEQIGKLEQLITNDESLVELRSGITKAAASKLENETITTSDYVQELQAETIAKLKRELHKIQLNEAREKYVLIKGKTLPGTTTHN
ncbi:TolC family protein [Draconibacterium halophilum]|uniref:TolC family protein n=1 Tax=Draconibacterium halophilum TaxID=2706887 RepID=A0A6C0RI26_9BACT|nr:TolC family protein [Draconibacterium halophilum]QIA09193.1 TolC family protein [Draconibacterium halophilum]